MQDRFKFRTYIPDLKFFKYWGWIDKNHYIGLCASGDTSMPELLEKYTEQCTGLKDKNGKLIYEGDIVEYTDEVYGLCISKIEWDNAHYELQYYTGEKYGWFSHILCLKYIKNIEIIGNIYETPELLESEGEA